MARCMLYEALELNKNNDQALELLQVRTSLSGRIVIVEYRVFNDFELIDTVPRKNWFPSFVKKITTLLRTLRNFQH